MKDDLKVFRTRVAMCDLRQILDYIATEDLAAAEGTYRLIRHQIENLQILPEPGQVVPKLQFHGVSLYRELVIMPWGVIQRKVEDKVVIFAVIDGRRDATAISLERLLNT